MTLLLLQTYSRITKMAYCKRLVIRKVVINYHILKYMFCFTCITLACFSESCPETSIIVSTNSIGLLLLHNLNIYNFIIFSSHWHQTLYFHFSPQFVDVLNPFIGCQKYLRKNTMFVM